jgi:hypothetical protein
MPSLGTALMQLVVATAANGLMAASVYALLRNYYFTPHQWAIDVLVLAIASTAHFWYMPGRNASFRIFTGVISACINAVLMFWIAVALGFA